MGPWLKLYRKSIESQVFLNEGLWKVWTWCLMRANWRDKWASISIGRGRTEVELKAGQFIYGRDSAAQSLHMKPSTTHDRMEKLVSMGNIKIDANSHFSVVTVCNWAAYQDGTDEKQQPSDTQPTAEQQPSNSRPTPNQQPSDTEEEGLEVLEDLEGIETLRKTEDGKPSTSAKLRFTDDDLALAGFIFEGILRLTPTAKKPSLEAWANDVRLLRERDNRTHDEIRSLFTWANSDPFRNVSTILRH